MCSMAWVPKLHMMFVAALVSPASSQEAQTTLNGCECKKEWTDAEHKCTDYCCEAGESLKWCKVVSEFCEDAGWGVCKASTNVAAAVGSCEDQAGWHDLDGDSCSSYSQNSWCTTEGKPGMGWHEEWGPLGDFDANGFTALSACCACGGGGRGSGNGGTSQRFTYGGCKCRTQWEEEGMRCEHTCCSPDADPAGDWCVVEDENCEDAMWGYCRPGEGGLGSPAPASESHGHCTDEKNWVDVDEEGCQMYASRAYCTEVGGYGLGWTMDWGTFSEFAKPDGKSPIEACCACGGGKHDQGHVPGQGTEEIDEDTKPRVTLANCECKKTWDMQDVGKCENYCCNPDNDAVGSWCMVEEQACEESDWGYCATSGLGLYTPFQGPLQDHAHCDDQANWKDSDGDNCDMYAASMWCTAGGKAGPGWHEEWGNVPDEALTACCVCGGGRQKDHSEDAASDVMSAVQSLLSEEPERMWWIASGPCKIDEEGCATSGNFPNKYDALEQCQIGVKVDNAKPIHVRVFETEYKYDVMKVNGVLYSGTRAPNGIVPTSTIFWGTDSQDQKKGWKLCPRGEVKQHKPGVIVLKSLGISVVVLLCCCCGALVGLWIHTYRNMPHGDGLGAGPTKIGKYVVQEDA